MKNKKRLKVEDVLQMSTEYFINYIETCFDPEVNSEFDPSFIRQVLEGEGAQEFKSFLISTLFPKDNDATQIKDKLQAPTKRTTRYSSVSSSYNTRNKIKVNEFQLYKQKFKLKKCKVILTDIAHSNNHHPSKLMSSSSPKRRKMSNSVIIKQEVEINYEEYFNCDICSQKFSNEAKLKDHHKACQIFKSMADIPITNVKTEEISNNSDPDTDLNPENETDTESHGVSDSDDSFHESEEEKEDESNSEDEAPKSKRFRPLRQISKSGETHFICVVCQRYFFTQEDLYTHKKGHNPNERFACPVCPEKFRVQIMWKTHMLDDHLPYVVEHNLLPMIMIPCTVPNCSKNLVSKQALLEHLSSSHQVEAHPKFNCNVSGCSKKFKEKKDLFKHQFTVHRIHTTRKKPSGFSCLNCELQFNKLEDASEHEETHKIEKPFKCDHCYKRFTRKDNVKRHQRLHEDLPAQLHVCPIDGCKAIFRLDEQDFSLDILKEEV